MFTGVTLPFTVAELVTGAFDLVKLISPFIILGLTFVLAPKFVTFFKSSLSGGKK